MHQPSKKYFQRLFIKKLSDFSTFFSKSILLLNTKRFPLTYADGRQTKGRHESRACRTSGGRQTSVRSPPKKNCGTSPQKRFFPAPRPETFGKPFFCGVALRFLPGQPQNATRSAGVSLPCSSEGARSPAGVFFAVPSRRRDALSSVPPSSAPPLLRAAPRPCPAAQVLRRST